MTPPSAGDTGTAGLDRTDTRRSGRDSPEAKSPSGAGLIIVARRPELSGLSCPTRGPGYHEVPILVASRSHRVDHSNSGPMLCGGSTGPGEQTVGEQMTACDARNCDEWAYGAACGIRDNCCCPEDGQVCSVRQRFQGQASSISISSEKLKMIRMTTIIPRTAVLQRVGRLNNLGPNDIPHDEDLQPEKNHFSEPAPKLSMSPSARFGTRSVETPIYEGQ